MNKGKVFSSFWVFPKTKEAFPCLVKGLCENQKMIGLYLFIILDSDNKWAEYWGFLDSNDRIVSAHKTRFRQKNELNVKAVKAWLQVLLNLTKESS